LTEPNPIRVEILGTYFFFELVQKPPNLSRFAEATLSHKNTKNRPKSPLLPEIYPFHERSERKKNWFPSPPHHPPTIHHVAVVAVTTG
jgi:hypothetical protein